MENKIYSVLVIAIVLSVSVLMFRYSTYSTWASLHCDGDVATHTLVNCK
jgi:hypothetical protein